MSSRSKVYVVTTTVGEYSDWSMDVVAVFEDQERAQQYTRDLAKDVLNNLDAKQQLGLPTYSCKTDEEGTYRVLLEDLRGLYSNWEAQVIEWEVS